MPTVLGNFPSINELLESPPLKSLVERVNPTRVMSSVRSFVDGMRQDLQTAVSQRQIPSPTALAEQIAQWIIRQEHAGVRAVINATGLVLHPELGSAPLADEAMLALREAAGGYSRATSRNLAGRGSRIEELLQQLTGCEAAVVTNNAALALSLVTKASACGREVLVPRCQLASSADGTRSYELVTAAGGQLRECGSTNHLHADDLSAGASERSAFLFWQQGLAFEVAGNHEVLDVATAIGWANKRSLPVVVDLGFGGLNDCSSFGLLKQPTVKETLQAGATAVIVRGDGLLGGPSCGLIVGRSNFISRLAEHPLFPATAADKLTLAALESTLELYRSGTEGTANTCERSIPLLALLATSADNLKHRCERLAPQLAASPALRAVEVFPGEAFLTGAKLPRERMSTWGLSLQSAQRNASELLAALAATTPAVVARLQGDRVWLDLRCVAPREDQQIVLAVEQLSRAKEAKEPAPV
ncbi:L-seryl-tRNA(Sec) selenium transferase [Anatilimnocola aggregata]|uniref:L-seryl-tRNA(Sec) selenium transferase n=1 Tax=Anatilimnocola aggregata TaxID=2528021 RepID=A0A517YLR3_9BACT|nr:L-seryl-tRNA(Sec) selenium transferase [Anatilimnocola aggregata]QDU31172.1 L-seryl-tRNA(Sec) selenium transferase [Anatilimnocola aggregata]